MSRLGSKRLTRAEIAELVRDERTWCGVAVVVKRQGEDAHYEITDTDVLVEVDLMPHRQPVTCRLAAAAGGPGHGLWRVPPEGSEVAVVIPGGELESEAMIVGVLASGTKPDGLDADTMVLVNPKNVIIKSDNGDIKIDADGAVHVQTAGGGAQPIARKEDPTGTGTLVAALAQAGPVVTVTLTWVPEGGGMPVPWFTFSATGTGTAGTYNLPLPGKITDGSSKADCG